MTQEEYVRTQVHPRTKYSMGYDRENAIGDHEAMVEEAIVRGETVPPEVLKDYELTKDLIKNSKNFISD